MNTKQNLSSARVETNRPSHANETGKPRWYVGARRNARYVVFISRVEPFEDTHGAVFNFCFGPYSSEHEAVTVARYQRHGEFPLYGYERGPSWQLLDCYKPACLRKMEKTQRIQENKQKTD